MSASSSAAAAANGSSSAVSGGESGELVFAGGASWSITGRNKDAESSSYDGAPKDQQLYSFHRLGPLVGVPIRKVFTGPVACHTVALSASGQTFIWGRNECGQLGLGDCVNRYNPMELIIPGESRITGGACGPHHTLVYTADGSLFAFGQCKHGQLGINRSNCTVKTPARVELNDIVTAGCGRDFSVVADARGHCFSFGCPEYGQLGNGTDGKMLEKAGKFTFQNETKPYLVDDLLKIEGAGIVEVACGANHTVARDRQGRLYTWGFGAYGRLGHTDNKDQHLPVAVELFSKVPPPPDPNLPSFMQRSVPKVRATTICCGATASFAVAGEPYFSLYMWGITKRSGEANMYPTMVDDLQGWKIRSVSCGNTSTIVAAEQSLITWGPSPTYGELGYGSAEGVSKSSTRAKEVEDLKGSYVLQVGMGYGHSLAIIDTSKDRSKELVEALGTFEPDEVDPSFKSAGSSDEPKVTNKRKASGSTKGRGKGKGKKSKA